MKITFLGAANEVTGSCTLIEVDGKNILIDCGMVQGREIFEKQIPLVIPAEIDCVFLTHAHIDHSGNLPLLYKNGFRGTVYATEATCSLCAIMLMDSAHIQKIEVDRLNRKTKRSEGTPDVPIYDFDDVEGVLEKFRPCSYDKTIQALENVQVRFLDAGHLLGSSIVEIWISESGETRKIVFTGDLGNEGKPIIKNPKTVKEADFVVIEATYGNRNHEKIQYDYLTELSNHLQRTFDRGGNVVIPSFAVGRSQELLYFIRQIKEKNMVKGHGEFKVYLDSPMAQEATGVFLQCDPDIFDEDTRALIDKGINPLFFDGLSFSVTHEDSIAINFDTKPKVIISASGMCEAGRIRHHLKHNLWRADSLILFAGYQTAGTLGRLLLDKATPDVRLFGEEIVIKAEIDQLTNTSGHADKQGLVNWLNAYNQKPQCVFVNHGTEEACAEFTDYLINEYGYTAAAPYSGTVYDLKTGDVVVQTEGVRIKKQQGYKDPRAVKVFKRLMDAVNRLTAVARKYEGMANKDIAKFADQIDLISNRWS